MAPPRRLTRPKSRSEAGPWGGLRGEYFFCWIFPYIFVAVGPRVGYFGVRGLVRAGASEDGPTSNGHVISFSMENHTSRDGGAATYHAEILYKFTVDGTGYNGKKVPHSTDGSSNPSHAR